LIKHKEITSLPNGTPGTNLTKLILRKQMLKKRNHYFKKYKKMKKLSMMLSVLQLAVVQLLSS